MQNGYEQQSFTISEGGDERWQIPAWMRGASDMPHTCRGIILLAARFHRDLSLGRTEVFLVASGWDEEGGVTSDGEEGNASFQPDGSSNTGSSPTSRDLMVMRTRASSSSGVGIVAAPWPKQIPESPKAAIHSGEKVNIGVSPSTSGRTESRKTSLTWLSGMESDNDWRNKLDSGGILVICRFSYSTGGRSLEVSKWEGEGVYDTMALESTDESASQRLCVISPTTIDGFSQVKFGYRSE
ncbi:hypothetical protein BJV78DRAFT_216343 [Lactifluus subvellereus]|nr:hypothetical protein BJV78DRAFT_216343 [Lactifluus subvellereus]